jgi:hypothetical protein
MARRVRSWPEARAQDRDQPRSQHTQSATSSPALATSSGRGEAQRRRKRCDMRDVCNVVVVFSHSHTHSYIHIHTHTYTYTYTHTNTHTHTHSLTHMHTHTCFYTYKYIYISHMRTYFPLSQAPSMPSYRLERTDSMENLLTCPICLDIVFEPVTVPCSHHMCLVCLKRLLEYEGGKGACPKCRAPLNMDPDHLTVNESLNLSVLNSYAEEMVVRQNTIQEEEKEYREARAERERHDHLMDTNPLQLMFESEDDPERRRVLNVSRWTRQVRDLHPTHTHTHSNNTLTGSCSGTCVC